MNKYEPSKNTPETSCIYVLYNSISTSHTSCSVYQVTGGSSALGYAVSKLPRRRGSSGMSLTDPPSSSLFTAFFRSFSKASCTVSSTRNPAVMSDLMTLFHPCSDGRRNLTDCIRLAIPGMEFRTSVKTRVQNFSQNKPVTHQVYNYKGTAHNKNIWYHAGLDLLFELRSSPASWPYNDHPSADSHPIG